MNDQLLLEFTEARDQLVKSLNNFDQAASRLAGATTPVTDDPQVVEELKALRKRLNRSIGVLVSQTGNSWHDVYTYLYGLLARKTGFNAVVVGNEEERKVYLDAVQDHGYLPKMLELTNEVIAEAPNWPKMAAT